jgi:hypothetical protein
MRRREFIGVLSGAIALLPSVGIARQRKVPTIGVGSWLSGFGAILGIVSEGDARTRLRRWAKHSI